MESKNKKKKVLTKKLIDNFEINKNDIEFMILYIIHKNEITAFSEEVVDYLVKEYSEYIENIIVSLPDYLLEVKKSLYLKGRGCAFRSSPRILKFFLSKMKNDTVFCKFIIDTEEYHRHAADHGLPA